MRQKSTEFITIKPRWHAILTLVTYSAPIPICYLGSAIGQLLLKHFKHIYLIIINGWHTGVINILFSKISISGTPRQSKVWDLPPPDNRSVFNKQACLCLSKDHIHLRSFIVGCTFIWCLLNLTSYFYHRTRLRVFQFLQFGFNIMFILYKCVLKFTA